MIEDDPYTYPGSPVLRNRFGIQDAQTLDQIERVFVTQRIREGIPTGKFDLAHLCAIHRHLFQDVFDWAGKLRTVEISKNHHSFQFRRFITTGMADVSRRLEQGNYLRDLTRGDFAAKAGEIMGDVNYVHPFREGNGRTQLQYLSCLAREAGHPIDLSRLDPARWLKASRTAHVANYEAMGQEIMQALHADKPA